MRNRVLVMITALVLTAGVTTSAGAFDRKTGRGAGHVKRVHTSGMNAARTGYGNQFSAPPYQGGYKDLGPLGVQFPCAPHGYCGQGYSVSAWSW